MIDTHSRLFARTGLTSTLARFAGFLLVVSALVGLAPAGIQMLFICALVLGTTIFCLQEETHV